MQAIERLEPTVSQSKIEAGLNTGLGFLISLASIPLINWITGVQMHAGQSLAFVSLFTLVSMTRQYVLRRLFNGRSIWGAIKCSVSF
jgi:hypothetical protein